MSTKSVLRRDKVNVLYTPFFTYTNDSLAVDLYCTAEKCIYLPKFIDQSYAMLRFYGDRHDT